jgi:hypothetical protein
LENFLAGKYSQGAPMDLERSLRSGEDPEEESDEDPDDDFDDGQV